MSLSRVKNGSENLLMDLFNYGVSNVQPRNILKKFINRFFVKAPTSILKTYKENKQLIIFVYAIFA